MAEPGGSLIVVTGMTGAGRSTAAKALEDLGWFVIDNLPPQLLQSVVQLIDDEDDAQTRIAVVVDVRSRSFFAHLRDAIEPDGRGARTATSAVPRGIRRRTRATSGGSPASAPAAGGVHVCSTGSPASARWCVTCVETPTCSSTRRTSTCTSSLRGSRRRSLTETVRSCAPPSCRSASSTAFRSMPTWSSTCGFLPNPYWVRDSGR